MTDNTKAPDKEIVTVTSLVYTTTNNLNATQGFTLSRGKQSTHTLYDDKYGALLAFPDKDIKAGCKNAAVPAPSDIDIASAALIKSGVVMDDAKPDAQASYRKEYEVSPLRTMCESKKAAPSK